MTPEQLLDPAFTDAVRGAMTARWLRAGETLFEQGDVAASLFVVESGSLKVVRRAAGGRSQILALMGPGDVFGEMSLLDGSVRDGTVTSVTDCEVLELSQVAFDELLATSPELTRWLMGLIAQRLRESNEVVSDMVFAGVPARVARLLLRLSDRLGREDEDGAVAVDHRLTQDELAQHVGAARETVNKALAGFSARGWIRVEQRSITILDAEPLRAMTA
jgi:CRP/FNR family transcriptional regulator, cyclic AMP receptor protein